MKRQKQEKRGRRGWIVAILAAVTLLASLPLMVNYCIDARNVSYFLRVLERGGAENPFFALPSLLIRFGMSSEGAYKLLLFVLNAATVYTAYASFRSIFSDTAAGIVGSMLYTWLPCRFNDLYCRGDVGEALAMTFLPLLAAVLYRFFAEDTESASYSRLWMPLTAVLSLLLWSYLLSFLTAVGFLLVCCIVWWKRTLQKPALCVLGKTLLAGLVCNGWLPLLLFWRLRARSFPLAVVGNGRIQSRGIYLSNYLQLYFKSGSSNDVAEAGMSNMQPYGVGFAVTVCLLVFLWLRFTGRYAAAEAGDAGMRFTDRLTAVGALFAVMTLNCFPWDALQELGGLFYRAVACLYEPTRLLPIAALCFTVGACGVVSRIRSRETKNIGSCFVAVIVLIALLGTQYLNGDILRTGQPRSLYGEPYAAEATQQDYEYPALDISPLDYARYAAAGQAVSAALYGAELVGVACTGALAVVMWRKKRVEKV